VNYHLERHGLIELVEERRKANVNDRMMRAAATSYVISPAALAAVRPDPSRSADRLSARWLLAVAARLVRDVAELVTGTAKARRRIATFAIDGEVRLGGRPARLRRGAGERRLHPCVRAPRRDGRRRTRAPRRRPPHDAHRHQGGSRHHGGLT
jgi:hypothetical protein